MNTNTNKTQKASSQPENARKGKTSITFGQDDVSELYRIILSRGASSTRTKLFNSLIHLAPDLAKRVEQIWNNE